MCGVVAVVGPARAAGLALARAGAAALRHRGPDAAGAEHEAGVTLGHSRLAVLDLDRRSDQPFRRGGVLLAYNGELWNHAALRAELARAGQRFATTGDTEVVAAALDTWTDEEALRRLDGMFALAWTRGDGVLRLARDRCGEVPLHVAHVGGPGGGAAWAAASELKGLDAVGARGLAVLVDPGSLVVLRAGARPVVTRWADVLATPGMWDRDEAAAKLRDLVLSGCAERSISDVPVATLLSGGIDSAAVAFGLKRALPSLVAYTAVLDRRSRDLRCAREAAEQLGLPLVEVEVPAPDADDLCAVVRAVELPHVAQVEIAWACLALARRMRSDGVRVAFSGEGSDELWGSYGFAYHGVREHGWHGYRRRLFLEQHRKNFARVNKVFLAHGVEPRLPFLHVPLVEAALSMPADVVQDRGRPKAVMQRAFAGLLPRSVVERPKVAFQDGMGLKAAVAARVPDPGRLCRAEYRTAYPRGG